MSEIEILYKLSQLEKEAVRAKKVLDEIPEAAQIMECRAKRKELKGKQDQVVELTDQVNEKLAKFEQEESKIIEKMKDLQDTLDHTADYRVTSSVTRDMEGLVKRQGTISEETDALLERQIKIDHLAEQVSEMLAKLDAKERKLTEAFKVKGGEAKARVDAVAKEKDEMFAQLDPAMQRRYEKVKAEKKTMPVAYLENGHCSVCRSQIQTGAMAKLKAGPEVTECPSCHRIFLVRIPE